MKIIPHGDITKDDSLDLCSTEKIAVLYKIIALHLAWSVANVLMLSNKSFALSRTNELLLFKSIKEITKGSIIPSVLVSQY
jgi:hypothetical protein